MPVHTQQDRLSVLAMVFEARYDEGYRFLDHTGELLVRIREHTPEWTVRTLGQKTVTLIHQRENHLLNIGIDKIDVSTTKKMNVAEAEKQARLLGQAAEDLYGLTLNVLKVAKTTRVGARNVFLAPSDNLEEADRFMFKGSRSPLVQAIVDVTKSQARENEVACVLDDPETGYRQRIFLASAVVEQKPGDPPYLGLPGDSGSGGVVVDVDTYQRPEETHLGKASLFVQDNFLKSRSRATELLAWLLRQQK